MIYFQGNKRKSPRRASDAEGSFPIAGPLGFANLPGKVPYPGYAVKRFVNPRLCCPVIGSTDGGPRSRGVS
jgi:hypothetical protein